MDKQFQLLIFINDKNMQVHFVYLYINHSV